VSSSRSSEITQTHLIPLNSFKLKLTGKSTFEFSTFLFLSKSQSETEIEHFSDQKRREKDVNRKNQQMLSVNDILER